MVFVNYIYDTVVDTQFHKFYGRPFARVLYVFLMKDMGRWLRWVLPGSTGRFCKDERDVVHNHSARGYFITRVEGGVRYAWYCYMLKNKTKLSKNCHPYNAKIGAGCISYEIQFEWWDEQNRCMYDNVKTTGAWYSCTCYSRSQQRSSLGLRLICSTHATRNDASIYRVYTNT